MSERRGTVTCSRSKMFSAGHFYQQQKFTESANRRVFGACFSPFGHGHNYLLEITLEGPLQPRTLQLVDGDVFEDLVSVLVSVLDHRHLNFDIPEFRQTVPTTENIALYLREKALAEIGRLRGRGMLADGVKLKLLRLFETPDLWAEVGG